MKKQLNALDVEKLGTLQKNIISARNSFLGYPVSKDFDYSELNTFLEYPINNLGDPFEDCTYKVQTHDLDKK
jgi:histidine decarboxylase